MRTATAALFTGFLFQLLAGCGGDNAPASPLAPRLEAAKAVADPAARDKDLVKLALEAGTAGDGPIANESLAAVSNDGLREQTKGNVVLRLAKAGKTDAASQLVGTIADGKTRDRLRLKIRSRDFSE
jgi:hypothetical protein